jgi:hypothetical protein
MSTLNVYKAANFTCTIGDKTFSAFKYANAGNVAVPDTAIMVTPLATVKNPTITFSSPAAWEISGVANQSYTGTINFVVTVNRGGWINDVTLSQGGATVRGSGTESAKKSFCATNGTIDPLTTKTCPPPKGGNLPGELSMTLGPPPGVQTLTTTFPTQSGVFPPSVTLMGVQDIINLATGNDMVSMAHVSQVSDSFSEAPELSTWAMLLVGFTGLGFIGYRRARVTSSAL